MLGLFAEKREHTKRTTPVQVSPHVILFTIWMLGWAVGLLVFDTLAGDSPVVLAYLLVMLTSGVWTVSLSLLPHFPHIPVSRQHMPKPHNVVTMDKLKRQRQSRKSNEKLYGDCYYICSDGELIRIEDPIVLRAIEEADTEMYRRQ